MPGAPGRTKTDVVALVTSAGGVGALTVVLRHLPVEAPVAVVVQQHLSPHGSTLIKVLGTRTGHDVVWAEDGAQLVPGQVAVCPPKLRMEILPDGTCSLIKNVGGAREHPHDALLTSLADSYRSRALAVVLTGMGRDGAVGAAALKAAGGFVIAQSADSAEYSAMPEAAAPAAHLVLPLPEIGSVLADVMLGRPLPRPRSEIEAAEWLFAGPGEVRELLRTMDWTRSPLGPVSGWPQELRVMVRTTLDSACPTAILWGPQLIQIYNEKWRHFLGDTKHPQALAGRARQTWPELWPVIGPMIERVMTRGEAVGDEDLPLFMDRSGYLEEVFVTFSYAPIRDATGAVVGVHNTAWDTTRNIVAERRVRTLRAIAAQVMGAATPGEACERAAAALASHPEDVPFALLYLLDDGAKHATLVAAAGLVPGSFAAPRRIDLGDGGAVWPLSLALQEPSGLASRNGGALVEGLGLRVRGLSPLTSSGTGTLPPRSAFLLPLHVAADEPPAGILVTGLNPHRPFDEPYRRFLDLVVAQIGAGLAQARATQRERDRLEQLAALDRAKTEFFSNVSHEFRTPLTLMLGPLEEMLRDPAGLLPRRLNDLELVRRNARRLLRLVGTLLDFSQIESARLRAQFAPTDLAARTRDIAAQFDSAATRAGLDLHLELPPLPEPVWVDADMWEKIVSNLLSNALKFTFDGGIDVTLRALPQHAELIVRDTGAGIPADELPFIFKRFHRVRDVRARTHAGAGIGLALVDELVRRHHGRIRAQSRIGEGSTFTVWVPLGRRQSPHGERPASPGGTELAAAMAEEAARWDVTAAIAETDSTAFETTEAEPARDGLPEYAVGAHVLVVDDNQDMRDYLTRLLGTHWHVTTAHDGTQALRLARQNPPDIVVSDVMMPRLDGLSLLRSIRGDSRLAMLPVILLTARAGEETAIEGLLSGADDYVVKPFSARELLARVAAQLELSRARRRAIEADSLRVRLVDGLRSGVDDHELQAHATRLLLEHLRCVRVSYDEVDADGVLTVRAVATADGARPGTGLLDHVPWQQAELRAQLEAGVPVVVEDARSDPAIPAQDQARYAEADVGGLVQVPVVEEGDLVATLLTQSRGARTWHRDEVSLIADTADRTRQAIQLARMERALRENRKRLLRVLETETVGVIYFDQTGTVIDANDVFLRMTGYSRADIDSGELTWRRMTPPEWVAVSEQQMVRLAATGLIGPYEKEYLLKNGTRRWMLFAGRDLGDGTISEFCIDITDLKHAEQTP
jgi:PAS domain S-box-containing protein